MLGNTDESVCFSEDVDGGGVDGGRGEDTLFARLGGSPAGGETTGGDSSIESVVVAGSGLAVSGDGCFSVGACAA